MTDLVTSSSSSVTQLLVSTLFGSSSTNASSTIDDIVSDWISSDDEGTYGDAVNDYAEVTQDAIDAYQDEINKGTTYNKALQSMAASYNAFVINSGDSNRGISADVILSVYQAENLSAIEDYLDSHPPDSSSSDTKTTETTST